MDLHVTIQFWQVLRVYVRLDLYRYMLCYFILCCVTLCCVALLYRMYSSLKVIAVLCAFKLDLSFYILKVVDT
jgi:hypothetical protein